MSQNVTLVYDVITKWGVNTVDHGRCEVFFLPRSIVVASASVVFHNTYVLNGWVRSVEREASNAELGAAIRDAWQETKLDQPMPDFRNPANAPVAAVLAAAKERSWTSLARKATNVLVVFDHRVLIHPSLRDVPNPGSFDHIDDGAEGWDYDPDDLAHLGDLVRLVMTRCA